MAEQREMESHSTTEPERIRNPSIDGGPSTTGKEKPKVVVIMGPTGSGKSRLAIDLGTHFPIEVINADSMQVYQGLDVLTNKVTLQEQKGLYHLSISRLSFIFSSQFLMLNFDFSFWWLKMV